MFYQQQPQQIRPYLEFQAHDVNGAKSSFDSSLAVNATSRTIGVVLLEAPSFGRFLAVLYRFSISWFRFLAASAR